MALTRITKGVIKPNENYQAGIVTATGLDDLYKWGKTKYQEAGQWFETKFGDIGDFLDEQFIDPLEKAAKGIAKSLGKELDDFVRAAGKELGSLGDAIGELFDDLFEDPQIKGLKIKRVGKGFQIEKLVPHPQEELALGFSIIKRAPINSSEKSIVALVRKGSEVLSIKTLLPSLSKMRSSSCFVSNSMLY